MPGQDDAPAPRWLIVADMARALAVDPSCVYKLTRSDKLGYSRVGTGVGRIRFRPEGLAAIAVPPKGPDDPAEVAPGLQISSKWTRPQGGVKPYSKGRPRRP